jgi:hypothetical protein
MKNLSLTTKAYILGITLVGLGLIAWTTLTLDWTNPWLYAMSLLGALAQTLKVEGPNARTNYSIAWFVYGFAFLALGLEGAVFVILIAHLVEWLWYRYPWYIQSFNIGNHIFAVFLAGLMFEAISRGTQVFDLVRALGLASANLVFVFTNHFLVGLVVKLARGQSFAESGVFEYLTVSLDFTSLSVGNVTALTWALNPYLGLLTVLPLFLLYQALRLPSMMRKVKEQEQ